MLKQDEAKITAGKRVIEEFVRDGMKLGLGSGSTSHFFVRELGKLVTDGLKVTCTTTSNSTIQVAREVGIEVIDPNDIGRIDLTIDGPDEIDNDFNMIKGGGACLLWEKIIAHASKQMITICDETKICEKLGAFPLPVEVVKFGWKQTHQRIIEVFSQFNLHNIEISRREKDGNPIITDSGHFILDCHCKEINEASQLELALNNIPGVVENGLFTREADGIVVGCFDGSSYIKIRH